MIVAKFGRQIAAALLISATDPLGIITSPALAQQQARTVVVTGLGKDTRSALQNAAENALTQVTGTFVRSDTTIERTSEIRGAIRSETRRIDSKMSEYAQGTISSIKILNATQEGPITRVEAQVSVRLSELKAFLEAIDVDTSTVGAEVAINASLYQKRTNSSQDIFLDAIIRPIATGTAVRYKIGTPFSIKDVPKGTDSFLTEIRQQLPSRTVAIPITVTIDSAHISNSLEALNAIGSVIDCDKYPSRRISLFLANTSSRDPKCYEVNDIEYEKLADPSKLSNRNLLLKLIDQRHNIGSEAYYFYRAYPVSTYTHYILGVAIRLNKAPRK